MRPMDRPKTIDEQMRQFGKNMRDARNRLGLAQDKLGLDKAMISILESGVRRPRLPTILRVASVLEVTPAALLEGIGTNEAGIGTGQAGIGARATGIDTGQAGIGANGKTPQPPPHGPDARTPAARFGANLKWARELHDGLSQMELAGEARVDRAGVSELERGQRDPMLHTILKLAWTLEVPAAVLLHDVQGNHVSGGTSGLS